jgi:ribosomal protein S18 acetylase RimI-like enzyme
MTIHVRDARPSDRPTLSRIFSRASLSNAGDRAALLAHPEALVLPDDLLARGRTSVATSSDGVVVGFASTRATEPGVLELDDLFVDPDARRRGAALQLIRSIATSAAAEDVVRIDVTANPHAFEFYRAAGFVAGSRMDTELGSGQRMHLDIAESPAVRQ